MCDLSFLVCVTGPAICHPGLKERRRPALCLVTDAKYFHNSRSPPPHGPYHCMRGARENKGSSLSEVRGVQAAGGFNRDPLALTDHFQISKAVDTSGIKSTICPRQGKKDVDFRFSAAEMFG